jgi:tRNA-dihydrouridine synthase 1
MASAHSIQEFRDIVNRLCLKYKPYHEGEIPWNGEEGDENPTDYNLKIPPWICQPNYRKPPEEHKQMLEEKSKAAETKKRQQYFDKDGKEISRKRMKKLRKKEMRAKIRIERHAEMCETNKCLNTRGLKCEFNLCRHCCRSKCVSITNSCAGHKILCGKKLKAEIQQPNIDSKLESMKTE